MDPIAVIDTPQTDVQPLFKKRGAKSNNIRKRPATPLPDSESDSSGYTSTEDEGRRIKRRKHAAGVTASSRGDGAQGPKSNDTSQELSTTKYSGDRSTQITDTNDATKHSNWFDEKNSKSLLGSTRPHTAVSTSNRPDADGSSTYKNVPSTTSSKPAMGPVKAPTNVRVITTIDFAPDVCKDYKQTGFCGFGDSCKFLHAREDYKQGWQLDKEWEKAGSTANKKTNEAKGTTTITDDMDSDEEEKALEKIPFACIICKQPYRSPIVTKCGHYFCESCALQRYRKNPGCAACGAGTNGVFNGAKNLRKLLDRKTERTRRKREEALKRGEEVDDDDGGDDETDQMKTAGAAEAVNKGEVTR